MFVLRRIYLRWKQPQPSLPSEIRGSLFRKFKTKLKSILIVFETHHRILVYVSFEMMTRQQKLYTCRQLACVSTAGCTATSWTADIKLIRPPPICKPKTVTHPPRSKLKRKPRHQNPIKFCHASHSLKKRSIIRERVREHQTNPKGKETTL